MGRWVGACAGIMHSLGEVLRLHVTAGAKHGDDAPAPVLAAGNGRTQTGLLWTYVRDDRISASKQGLTMKQGSPGPAQWRESEHADIVSDRRVDGNRKSRTKQHSFRVLPLTDY